MDYYATTQLSDENEFSQYNTLISLWIMDYEALELNNEKDLDNQNSNYSTIDIHF